MTRSRFSQTPNSANKSSSGAMSIAQLVLLGLAITVLAAIFVQNLQPTVQIFFLGQKTLPIPLSWAMLTALVGGGLLAFVINAIATWRHNQAVRRAVVAAGYGDQQASKPANYKNETDEDDFDDRDDWDEDDDFDQKNIKNADPDTVPYGDRANLKDKNNNQLKDDRPPLDAKYVE